MGINKKAVFFSLKGGDVLQGSEMGKREINVKKVNPKIFGAAVMSRRKRI